MSNERGLEKKEKRYGEVVWVVGVAGGGVMRERERGLKQGFT